MAVHEQEYSLSSIDQALMDEWANRVRECYREMTQIARQAMESAQAADTTEAIGPDPFHDTEVCWALGSDREICYLKNGGKIVIRSKR